MRRFVGIYILLLLMAMAWYSCQRPTEPPYPNTPPSTKLANVPIDNDTVFALATLNWTGGDNDGYVARYQYRYVTYHLQTGSTTIWKEFDSTQWKDTTATAVTIAFNSSENLNRQRFMVRAVDNTGAVDPNPAEKIIYTTKASPPITKIYSPAKNDSILGLSHTTDWWTGITLKFSGVDQTVGGGMVDFAWSVDGGSWNWGTDTSIVITSNYLAPPLSGRHYIRVTSRNNTNLIDPVGDSCSFMLIIPTFEKDVLIVDETDEFNLPSIWYNTPDSTFDNYYNRLFPGADNWDYKSQGAPSRPFLSHYKVIMWHADNYPVASNAPHKIADPKNIEIFTDYLKVGGKFVMSGWGILKSFDITKGFPRSFGAGSFVFDYLHINQVNETGPIGDCTGGYAALPGFHDFKVDSAKLSFSLYSGMLGYVNLISATAGFTVALFSYENYPSSTYVSYRGRTMALRYYGTSYDAVVLGFPLFFIREADAAVMVQDILRSLKVQ